MSVPETLGLRQAAARDWDVVVVGAGPAGSLAALALAGWGVPTLLVERSTFPRYKVCGCCINGRACAVLERRGRRGRARPIRRGPPHLRPDGGRQTFRPAQPGGRLFALAGEIRRGAGGAGRPGRRRTSCPARGRASAAARTMRGSSAASYCIRGKRVEVRARVVLAADGLGGGPAGAGRGTRPRRARSPDRGGRGADLGRARSTSRGPCTWRAAGRLRRPGPPGGRPARRGRRFRRAGCRAGRRAGPRGRGDARRGRLAGAAGLWRGRQWRGTPPLTRRAPSLAAERVFVLGDAAGYVEPFTGEGMAWALASARPWPRWPAAAAALAPAWPGLGGAAPPRRRPAAGSAGRGRRLRRRVWPAR